MRPAAALALAAVLLAPVARAENLVYLRLNPASFALHGTTPTPVAGKYGGHPGWLPDLFGLGFEAGAFDVSFQMTETNPFPANDSYSLLYARLAFSWRPLKTAALSVFDPYVFGGGGFGGAGKYSTEAGCVSTPTVACTRAREGWGGGGFLGVGLDANFTVSRLETGQRLMLFVGLEARAEAFVSNDPGGAFSLFSVFSLPVGVKLE